MNRDPRENPWMGDIVHFNGAWEETFVAGRDGNRVCIVNGDDLDIITLEKWQQKAKGGLVRKEWKEGMD